MAHILTNEGYSVTVFGRFAPQYIRTDRNGTKIYHDPNCPRCGGEGESDNWWRTGGTCYTCGGSGKRAKPLAVKVYTQEYADKLEARRAAKAAAEAEANAAEAEYDARRQARREAMEEAEAAEEKSKKKWSIPLKRKK